MTKIPAPVALHVEERGHGRPLLLLHGLGSTHADWRLVAPALAEDRLLLLPDARMHGQSPRPAGSCSPVAHAADVAALLEARGLRDVDVVGLSMGGMTALQLAVSRPDLVRSVVVINSGPAVRPQTIGQAAALLLRLVLTVTLGPRRLAPLVVKRLFPKPGQAAERDEVLARLVQNPRGAYVRASWGLLGWSVRRHLPALPCPVLVVCGDRDYTPVSAHRAWSEALRRGRLEVVGDSGHATPGDQPEALTTILRRFLRDVDDGLA